MPYKTFSSARGGPQNRTNMRRNGFRRFPKQPIVGDRDLSTQKVSGPDAPPQHVANPPVNKIVRLSYNYTGATLDQNISPANIFTQDDADYGSSSLRYQKLRVTKAEIWFAINTPPTAGGNPTLSLTDPVSTVFYTDTPATGVDWAHIAMRYCLTARQAIFGNDTATAISNFKIQAAEGATGIVKIDLSVVFF